MGKRKLQHFAEMETFSCVVQPDLRDIADGEFYLRGKWSESFFRNQNPITLELGCGKGEYTIALARKYPERNFVGIDVKGARLWRGSKTADTEELTNVAFIRTKIEFIESFFAPQEVDEIWLTFSDPQPKDRKGTKRLTGQKFLERYEKIIKPEGLVHVKTDSASLYRATLKTLAEEGYEVSRATDDLYDKDFRDFSPAEQNILSVKTFYEMKFLAEGKNIHYIQFPLHGHSPQDI